jgi:hypothetical protein
MQEAESSIVPVVEGEQPLIYRAATRGTLSQVTDKTGKGLSFRDSLSNSLPKLPNPVFGTGRNYIGVDPTRLPPGSVVYDGGTIVNGVLMPPGHVSVFATPQQIVDATVTSGKLPK